jgi:hypothetical protein
VRLLPAFDTYLLGYRDRELAVAAPYAGRVNAGGGIIHPVVLDRGRAVGTWKLRRSAGRPAGKPAISVEPFETLPASLQPAIDDEIADLARFLGTAD